MLWAVDLTRWSSDGATALTSETGDREMEADGVKDTIELGLEF